MGFWAYSIIYIIIVIVFVGCVLVCDLVSVDEHLLQLVMRVLDMVTWW